MNTPLSLIGRGEDDERTRGDFYPTPPWVTRALLERENFEGNIWECACGKGDISEELIEAGYNVYSSDIVDYNYGTPGIDFLNDNPLLGSRHGVFNNIITNPPFNKSLDFVFMAKKWSRKKIALFLRLGFLEGKTRFNMFQDKEYPLKNIYVFSRRISFGQYAGTHDKGGMIPFAWYVWDKEYEGEPTIKWIK